MQLGSIVDYAFIRKPVTKDSALHETKPRRLMYVPPEGGRLRCPQVGIRHPQALPTSEGGRCRMFRVSFQLPTTRLLLSDPGGGG